MKIPLRYQTTEFDCGPTALMNAVSFLFDIETIPPEIPKHISTIGNDRCDPSGRAGWWGTSPDALCYAACWLNTFSRNTGFPLRCEPLKGGEVRLCPGSRLRECLEQGGAALVSCWLDTPHYVTLTGLQGDNVQVFDPYYREEQVPGECGQFVFDRPKVCNRLIPAEHMDETGRSECTMCDYDGRIAILLFKTGEARKLI